MTEVEQVLVALILEAAEDLESKKYRNPLSHLREDTEGRYALQRHYGAFESAIQFLEDRRLATIHSYPGVEDYISIDLSSTTSRVLMGSMLKESTERSTGFEFSSAAPRHPILASYLDLGASWLHDVALTFRDGGGTPDAAIRSEAWTGRYSVSDADRARLSELVVQMRQQIETSVVTNAEKSNALAALNALETLSEAPDPPWSIIVRILSSPILANVAALAALAISIIKP